MKPLRVSSRPAPPPVRRASLGTGVRLSAAAAAAVPSVLPTSSPKESNTHDGTCDVAHRQTVHSPLSRMTSSNDLDISHSSSSSASSSAPSGGGLSSATAHASRSDTPAAASPRNSKRKNIVKKSKASLPSSLGTTPTKSKHRRDSHSGGTVAKSTKASSCAKSFNRTTGTAASAKFRSFLDDAPVETCLEYLTRPHTSWANAAMQQHYRRQRIDDHQRSILARSLTSAHRRAFSALSSRSQPSYSSSFSAIHPAARLGGGNAQEALDLTITSVSSAPPSRATVQQQQTPSSRTGKLCRGSPSLRLSAAVAVASSGTRANTAAAATLSSAAQPPMLAPMHSAPTLMQVKHEVLAVSTTGPSVSELTQGGGSTDIHMWMASTTQHSASAASSALSRPPQQLHQGAKADKQEIEEDVGMSRQLGTVTPTSQMHFAMHSSDSGNRTHVPIVYRNSDSGNSSSDGNIIMISNSSISALAGKGSSSYDTHEHRRSAPDGRGLVPGHDNSLGVHRAMPAVKRFTRARGSTSSVPRPLPEGVPAPPPQQQRLGAKKAVLRKSNMTNACCPKKSPTAKGHGEHKQQQCQTLSLELCGVELTRAKR